MDEPKAELGEDRTNYFFVQDADGHWYYTYVDFDGAMKPNVNNRAGRQVLFVKELSF
jgi:hypothetical protein